MVAEARYLRGEPLTVEVFIEVGMVVAVRKLITLPVSDTPPDYLAAALWTGVVLALAIVNGVVRWAHPHHANQADGPVA